MNDTQRSQVLDNARYLRQVRPLDPAEIAEYVEGQPHPATVRQVLRESAFELGIRETDDGRFEPVSEDPISVTFAEVTSLPAAIADHIETLLVEEYGPHWYDGASGAKLRETIRSFKEHYRQRESVTYDSTTALGYTLYHLPASYAAVQYVLADLIDDGLVPARCRILDIGAGVGGQALGIDHLLEGALLDYHAVEPSEPAADVFESLWDETGPNSHLHLHREPIESFDPDHSFDLIIVANVLNELDAPAQVVQRALAWLDPDGTLLALSPADRNIAIGLRDIERVVEQRTGATIYAPTVRLWPNRTPESTSWSFTRKADIAVPQFQRRLDTGDRTDAELAEPDAGDPQRMPGDGEFVNVDVQYAYSVLRTDGTRSIAFRPDPSWVAPLAESEQHITDRIDCVAIKLSHNLAPGTNPLFLVGDGSQRVDHFAVVTNASTLNEALQRAAYGDLLRFENVLVLWNDDEGAINLVVDQETIVDRLTG